MSIFKISGHTVSVITESDGRKYAQIPAIVGNDVNRYPGRVRLWMDSPVEVVKLNSPILGWGSHDAEESCYQVPATLLDPPSLDLKLIKKLCQKLDCELIVHEDLSAFEARQEKLFG